MSAAKASRAGKHSALDAFTAHLVGRHGLIVPRLPSQTDRAWLQFLKRIHESLDHHSLTQWGKSQRGSGKALIKPGS